MGWLSWPKGSVHPSPLCPGLGSWGRPYSISCYVTVFTCFISTSGLIFLDVTSINTHDPAKIMSVLNIWKLRSTHVFLVLDAILNNEGRKLLLVGEAGEESLKSLVLIVFCHIVKMQFKHCNSNRHAFVFTKELKESDQGGVVQHHCHHPCPLFLVTWE